LLEFIANNIILFVALIILLFLIISLESKLLFGKVKPISYDELTKLLNSSKVTLLDLRDDSEYKKGHIFSAKNINYNDIEAYKAKDEVTLVTYGATDSDAQKAANIFSGKGVKEVFYLEGGINSWVDNNMPLSGEK
jgi:rhodanese-related sulfurtransferase